MNKGSWKSEIRMWSDSGEIIFWIADCPFRTVSSHGKGTKELLVAAFIRSLIPFKRT